MSVCSSIFHMISEDVCFFFTCFFCPICSLASSVIVPHKLHNHSSTLCSTRYQRTGLDWYEVDERTN